jgi:error-prone DNA polymerase
MSMLPRLKPKEFYDLVIEVAIVRPGPIQGDMVHPYLRRRQGLEAPDYPRPELEAILRKTLGVPLFQEQAMRIAIEAGGFSPDKADRLRRAMATFKRTGTIGTLKQEMIEGMTQRGYPLEFAERCFKQIEGFGEYGFPESHAAAFALLVYASCWFKTFYPDVFCAAILNAQPMGFYQPAQLVRDAQDHGIAVLPVDINASAWDCTLEPGSFDRERLNPRHREMADVIRSERAVRLGFRQVSGLSQADVERLLARRGSGYDSVRDLWLRSGLSVAAIERLAEADVFRSLGLDRRDALWAVRALDGKSAAERLPLFDRAELRDLEHEPEIALPAMPLGEHVIHDYRALGLSLKAHPVSFLRSRLARAGVSANADLPGVADGRRVWVSGLVLVRQRPGNGNAIFLTLEDEGAVANIIVWPRVFERFRPIVLGGRFIRARGKLQAESGVIHIVAERFEDLTPWLADLTEVAATRRQAALPARAAAGQPPAAELSRQAGSVMPKGRNFQ